MRVTALGLHLNGMIPWTFRRQTAGAPFIHPLHPAPRTAILTPGFRQSNLIRTFPEGWCSEAERFRPTALAADLVTLLGLADSQIPLEHALIVFTSFGQRLTDPDRDILWAAFGVPIFEQVLAHDNSLLATECEAHAGLHLVDPATYNLDLDHAPCACGSPLPRLQPEPVGALVS